MYITSATARFNQSETCFLFLLKVDLFLVLAGLKFQRLFLRYSITNSQNFGRFGSRPRLHQNSNVRRLKLSQIGLHWFSIKLWKFQPHRIRFGYCFTIIFVQNHNSSYQKIRKLFLCPFPNIKEKFFYLETSTKVPVCCRHLTYFRVGVCVMNLAYFPDFKKISHIGWFAL